MMGKSLTPTYRMEMKMVSGHRYTPMTWRARGNRVLPGYGKPTPENIDKWVTGFEQSMIDGPNKHLGIDQVVYAKIINQFTGDVVAEWSRSEWRKNQPMFQIINQCFK